MAQESTLEKVYHSSLRFLEPLGTREVYVEIIKRAVALTVAKDGAIYIKTDGAFDIIYGSSASIKKVKLRRKGFAYQALQTCKPVIVYPAQVTDKSFKAAHPELKKDAIQVMVFVPLLYQKKSIGVLLLRFTQNRQFDSENIYALQVLASLAVISIHRGQLKEQINRAFQTRDLFISLATHELRTPMTAITGYAQLLQSKFPDAETTQSRWISNLVTEVNRMNSLISELLVVNQIKSGKFQYTWKASSIKEIVQKSVAEFQSKFADRQLFFTESIGDTDDKVVADSTKLKQVFDNLLDNAIKFSPPKKPIQVRLSKKENFFHIEVEDRGVGIKKSDLGRVFNEFYKSGSQTTHQGLGVGLFLVKSIVQHHHGKIKIESQRGKKTVVSVDLQVANSSNTDASPTP